MAQAKKTIQTFSSKTRTTTRTTFSQILSSARMNQHHLAGKRNSRRHSSTGLNENIAVAEKSYQMLEVLLIILRCGEGLTSFSKNNHVNFSTEKRVEWIFWWIREKTLRQTSSSNLTVSYVTFALYIAAKLHRNELTAKETNLIF